MGNKNCPTCKCGGVGGTTDCTVVTNTCDCKVSVAGVGTDAVNTVCEACTWSNGGSCSTSDETEDWDPEYCFYHAAVFDLQDPGTEPTIRRNIDCSLDSYDESTCNAAAGCEWTDAHCDFDDDAADDAECTDHQDEDDCENDDDCNWKDAACGIDSDTAFIVCDANGNLKTADFGDSADATNCVIAQGIANKDYSQPDATDTYTTRRSYADNSFLGSAWSTFYYTK